MQLKTAYGSRPENLSWLSIGQSLWSYDIVAGFTVPQCTRWYMLHDPVLGDTGFEMVSNGQNPTITYQKLRLMV